MQLNLFNGGLSTRFASHLIQQTEAIEYDNIDTQYGALVPMNGNTDMNISVTKSIYNFKNNWISANEDRTYVEFQSKLYYSNGIGKPQRTMDGVTWHNVGIDKPTSIVVTSNSTPSTMTGTYQYCYTYYNSLEDIESVPSTYSTELVTTLTSFNISVVASTDTQVDKIRIYRLGGDNITMSKVVELSNTSTTYVDSIGDAFISGEVLDSYTNNPAPSGLKYLTESNTMFFGAIGDKLYYSDIAYVNYWNPFYFIDFDDTITGIGNVQNGLLVFTKFKTYIIVGNGPTTLSKYLLSTNQGCVAHSSIQYVKNTLIWVSTDGICASTGGDLEVISKNNLGKLSMAPICSIVYDEVYYVSTQSYTLLVDFRFGLSFGKLTNSIDSLTIYNDTLYGAINSKLYSIGTSTQKLSMHYLSPLFSDGSISLLKNYKSIYVHSTGNINFKVYIDGELLSNKDLESGVEEVKILQHLRTGYHIQFEVTGTGSIYEIEYKAEGRQNGK